MLDVVYERIRRRAGWIGRTLIRNVANRIGCNNPGLYIISLPTGYGKSSIVFSSAVLSLIGSCSFSTIYASPLRSLSDDVYYRFKQVVGNAVSDGVLDRVVGLQYTGSPGSIYLNKPVVFTTMDTLSLHILKTPPPEMGKIIKAIAEGFYYVGHHEVSRGTLADSTVFMDEPHIAVNDPVMLRTLITITLFLRFINSNVVFLTATMPQGLIKLFKSNVFNSIANVNVKVMRYGYEFIDEWFESKASLQMIRTRYEPKSISNEDAGRLLGDDRRLIVVNTRRRAVRTYARLMGKARHDVFILHGFMTKKDRLDVQERVKRLVRKREPVTLVSTQVVEAGFDASFDTLITEEAPVLSLVQRAGRVARWGEESGDIFIHSAESPAPYLDIEVEMARQALIKFKDEGGNVRVAWRNADSPNGYISYIDLVDKYTYIPKVSSSEIHSLLKKVRDPVRWVYHILVEVGSGSLVRNARMTPVYVEGRIEEGEIPASPSDLKHLYRRRCIKSVVVLGEEKPIGYAKSNKYYHILKSFIENPGFDTWLKMVVDGVEGFMISSGCYEAEAYGAPGI